VAASVADVLGVSEAGTADDRAFEVIGDDWDIESRVDEALAEIGFSAADLHRRVGEVSGSGLRWSGPTAWARPRCSRRW
jgi:hypothetical protein